MNIKKFSAAVLAAAMLAVTVLVMGMLPDQFSAMASVAVHKTLQVGNSFIEGDLQYEVLSDGTLEVSCPESKRYTITKAVIPTMVNGRAVTSISSNAFFYCKNLTYIFIPESIITICERPMDSTFSLSKIEVDDKNQYYSSVDGVLFNKDRTEIIKYPNNKSGEQYTLLNGVKRIASCAFFESKHLKTINLPDSLKEIYKLAFAGSEKLESITIPKNVDTLYNCVFSGCTALKEINADPQSNLWRSEDGVLYLRSNMFKYPPAKDTKDFVVPEGTDFILIAAFNDCVNLNSVTLPNSLVGLHNSTFERCDNLKKIITKDGASNYHAENGILFNGDKTVLERYPTGLSASSYKTPSGVSEIGEYAFSNVKNLNMVIFSDEVRKINESAFFYCYDLTSIFIDKSVTEIAKGAFWGSLKLTDIYYAGSEKDWNKISVDIYDYYYDPLSSVTVHYNSTPDDIYDPPKNESTTTKPTSSSSSNGGNPSTSNVTSTTVSSTVSIPSPAVTSTSASSTVSIPSPAVTSTSASSTVSIPSPAVTSTSASSTVSIPSPDITSTTTSNTVSVSSPDNTSTTVSSTASVTSDITSETILDVTTTSPDIISDSDKNNPNIGVVIVVSVIGAVALVGAAVIAVKKRK